MPTLHGVKLGLALPQHDAAIAGETPLLWDTVVAWARHAQRLGVDSLFLSDHITMSVEKYGGPVGDVETLEPLVALGALAPSIDGVRLGTLALAEPIRPPAVAAKYLAALARLLPGRLIVTVGAGWFLPDFQRSGVEMAPLPDRASRLAETIEILGAMFTGEPTTFSGHWHAVRGARSLPAAEPRPSLWVGGATNDLIALAAAQADGWNVAWRWTPDSYQGRLRAFERACATVDRDPDTVERSVSLYALVGENERDLRQRYERMRSLAPPGVLANTDLSEFRRDRLVGTVEDITEQLAAWAALGVSTVVVTLGGVPFSATIPDDLELLSSAFPQE